MEKETRRKEKERCSVVSQLTVQEESSPGEVVQNTKGETQNNQDINETGRDVDIWEIVEEETIELNSDTDKNRTKELKKKKMFICLKCKKKFHKKRYAEDHCKEKTPWICPNCFAEIDHVQNIKRHTERCTNSTPKVQNNVSTDVKCEKCNKVFSNSFNLRRHKMRAHKVFENNAIVCDVKTCPYTTKNAAQLKRHKTMKHTKTIIFDCNQCGQKFLSLSGLQKHIRSDHRFGCKNCAQTFSMEKQLRQHNRVVHNTAREEVGIGHQTAVIVSRVIGEHATHKIFTGTQQGATE